MKPSNFKYTVLSDSGVAFRMLSLVRRLVLVRHCQNSNLLRLATIANGNNGRRCLKVVYNPLVAPCRGKKKKAAPTKRSVTAELPADVEQYFDGTQFEADITATTDSVVALIEKTTLIRTNISAFENIDVILGDRRKFALGDLARLTMQPPQLLVELDDQTSADIVKAVKEALSASPLGVTPAALGSHSFQITIPRVTREHREKLLKAARETVAKARKQLRLTESKYLKRSSAAGANDLSADAKSDLNRYTDSVCRKHENRLEELLKRKEQELFS